MDGWAGHRWVLPRSLVLALTSTDDRAKTVSSWPADENYWLGHCEGFWVDRPDGRLGVVEHVVYRSRVDRPDAVAVRRGLWRSQTVTVPVADVVEVRPSQSRLVVRSGPVPAPRRGWWVRARRASRAGSPAREEQSNRPRRPSTSSDRPAKQS